MELLVLGMILLVVAASPFVLLILHLIARDRMKKLERAMARDRDSYEARLVALEAQLQSVGSVTRPAAISREEPASAMEPATESPQEPTVPAAAAERRPIAVSSSPNVNTSATAASTRSSAEWEEIIGASWLSKIGSVVLVVGIALTLGYSMRWLGPAGRVMLGLAMSASMLGCGVALEGRERYRMVARGLVGGGWAGLYFTTFAMHGLDAARIVYDPVVATGLLIGVSAAMLGHALSYRSETITAMAYFVTFVTLAFVPASRFALAASVPAAVSLLYIGRRFRWAHMMVAGVVFTYGAYLLRAGAPDLAPGDWVFRQALLFVYWGIFEAFDVMSLRGRSPGGIDETLMPINAVGFVGVSLLGWSGTRPDSLWMFFVLAAAGFAASALLRAWLLGEFLTHGADPDAADPDGANPDGRPGASLSGGGYAASLSVAAFLLVFAIERGFDGWRQNVAWLLEAQLLVLSGITLRNAFLRRLGSAVLVVPFLALVLDDLPSSRSFVAWGRAWLQSTPLALLTAAVLYGDRALLRRAHGLRVEALEYLYNGAASFIVMAVLANELPDVWLAPAWFVLGLSLFCFSVVRGAGELYIQGYVAMAAAWFVTLVANVPTDDLVWNWPARWATALPVVAALYALAYTRRASLAATGAGPATSPVDGQTVPSPSAVAAEVGIKPSRIDAVADWLDRRSALTMSSGATLLMAWFLLFEVSGRWLTVAWGLQGVALLAAGLIMHARGLRLGGLCLLGLCIAKLFVYDLSELDTLFQIFSFVILGTLLIAVSFAYSRYREQIRSLL